jgi:phosphate transport system permease protein
MMQKRIRKDRLINALIYVVSSLGIMILGSILYFIFSHGISLLNIHLLTDNYYAQNYDTRLTEDIIFQDFSNPNIPDSYFSQKWGIALKDARNKANEPIVEIVSVDPRSPFRNMEDANKAAYVEIREGMVLERVFLEDQEGHFLMGISLDGAEKVSGIMEQGVIITDMITYTSGGGIRGSIIATFYLILLTLVMALPLGISAAIYLNEFSHENRFNEVLRSMIDMTSGIPSIIFGLIGVIVFIPLTSGLFNTDGGNLLSGALTMTIILLPIIIRTTEEALRVIPKNYRYASLALGANETQTTFKVVLPNAISGILTATLLSVGRIIGESAALIYVLGTVIKDRILITDKATTLAVHIWSLMSGENPNFELSSAISIIILVMVFILSMVVKLIAGKLNYSEVK